MSITSIRGNAKRRNRNFTPGWIAKSGYGRLEARALTAPAIFRRPPSDPLEATDLLTATVIGQPVDNGVNAAVVAGTIFNAAGTMSVLQMASIGVIDSVNPNAPAAPVGTYEVSFASDVTLIHSGGAGAAPNALAATTLVRNYVLADTNPGGSVNPAVVTESFTMGYTFQVGGMFAVGLATPGMTVVANGAGTTVTIPGFASLNLTTSSSGTIGGGQTYYSYSFIASPGLRSLTLTATRPVGILPGAGTNPNGTATGIPWNVASNTLINTVSTIGGTNDLKTTYKLDIA
ncbi:hypothetical protein [Paludisphaera borealis]|uniref:Uncharacterized protein n=1 Tax=Paludisphaera borealis TaxID=1387353 RepID=A0A1U7CIG4_9BACT|nr:hypothetical protein [Paludisphaera borealis]APW58697.1 hypothetical protein BSF38_00097 [Paludisphaera borealis]